MLGCCCSVIQLCPTLATPWIAAFQASCPSSSPRIFASSCSLYQWCHPVISSSDTLFSFCPQSFPASGTFQWVSCLHQITKVLEFQIQHQSFQVFRIDFLWDWLVCPGNSQESSPAPQFQGISSLTLSLLHKPILKTICDQWEDHSLDCTNLCWQSDVSAFEDTV